MTAVGSCRSCLVRGVRVALLVLSLLGFVVRSWAGRAVGIVVLELRFLVFHAGRVGVVAVSVGLLALS